MAAGQVLLDATGKRMFDANGKVMLAGSSGVCCLYQARKCSDGTLANVYVSKTQFPSFPSTHYFKTGGVCYYVQSSDVVACNAGAPVSSPSSISSCSDSSCSGGNYVGCPTNTDPTLPTSVHVGLTDTLLNVGFPSKTLGCGGTCIGDPATYPGWDGNAPLGQVSYGDLCLEGCHYYNRAENQNYSISCTDGTCITLEDFCIECLYPSQDPMHRGVYLWQMQFLISYDPYDCGGVSPCYYCHAFYSLLGTATGPPSPTGTYNQDSVDSAANQCTPATTGNPFPATVEVS